MRSLLFTITGILGLLLVPAIEIKRKRCHKRPTVVECPNPSTRTCANMTVTAEERLVGSTGKVTCSNGYFLMGNDSITCLEDGVSNGNGFGVAELRSFSGSIYIFVKNVDGYDKAKEFCSSMCGTLVEINTKEENRFIYSALSENGLASPLIGLESKNGVSYEWQSTNTTDSNMFNDWHSTQPDQTAVGSCAQIFTYFYKWIDISKSY